MRLALFQKLSKAEQDKVVARERVEVQKAYKEMCKMGVWHDPPKGFLKKGREFVLWEANKKIKNMEHNENCPLWLHMNGKWNSTEVARCTCTDPAGNYGYMNRGITSWECPRCHRIHHILKQTCDCPPIYQNSSTAILPVIDA